MLTGLAKGHTKWRSVRVLSPPRETKGVGLSSPPEGQYAQVGVNSRGAPEGLP